MRLLLPAVLVLALAAAAWLLLARGGEIVDRSAGLIGPSPPSERSTVALPAVTAPAPTVTLVETDVPAMLVAAPPPGADLAPVGRLRGRVVNDRAEPLADAHVLLLEGQRGPISSGDELRLDAQSTGADGRFGFERVPAGREVSLLVRLGARRRWMPALATDPGAALDLGDVVLGGPVALRGRTLDERGAPVAGAEVLVGDVRAFFEALGQVLLDDLAVDVDRLVADVALASVRSDAAGDFAIEGLQPGAMAALARAPGRANTIRPVLLVPECPSLDLVLRSGGSASGRVMSASAAPVAGALVGVAGDDELWFAHATTDSAGRFVLHGVAEGGNDLFAAARGFEPAQQDDVEPGDHDVLITLQPLRGAVVTVLAPDGAPAEDVMLRLRPLREGFFDAMLGVTDRWSFADVARGPPGVFELTMLPDRRHIVQAVSRGGLLSAPAWITPASPPTATTLQLARPRRVRGRLTDAENGDPLAGAEVRVLLGSTPDTDPDGPSFTDADGRFEVDVPDGAACGLFLSAAQHVDASLPLPPGMDEVAPTLQPAGSLRVFISHGTADSQLAPVSVRLEPRAGGDARRAGYVVETCVFSGLPAGEWDVELQAESWLGNQPPLRERTTVTVLPRRQAVVEL